MTTGIDHALASTFEVIRRDDFFHTRLVMGPQGGLISRPLDPDTPHVFYVDSARGSDHADGQRPERAMATIDAAIGRCEANRCDIIIVMPGHTETISAAAGIALDVAGVSIIGLGFGSLKPTITLGTAVTADFNISGGNNLVRNLAFVSDIDSLEMILDIDVGNVIVEDCDFSGPSTKEVLNFVNLATTKDDFVFRNCKFKQAADPAGTDAAANTGVFYMVDTENVLIENCEFYGYFETGIVHNKTTAAKNVWFKDCRAYLALSTSVPFELVDGCTGAMLGGGIIMAFVTDATMASLYGTLGAGFFILQPASFGNDGGAEQGGIVITAAS